MSSSSSVRVDSFKLLARFIMVFVHSALSFLFLFSFARFAFNFLAAVNAAFTWALVAD
jgi:hypothetical protein